MLREASDLTKTLSSSKHSEDDHTAGTQTSCCLQDYYYADWTEDEQAEGLHLAVSKFVSDNLTLNHSQLS